MGHLDIPITHKGSLLAKKLSLHLKGVAFTGHYSSPLGRAIDTTKLIFPFAEIIVDNNLRERGLGLWTGMSIQSVREEYPKAFLQTGSIDPLFTPPEGESFKYFVDRVASFLTRISSLEDKQHIAVVSHNGVIRVLRSLIECLPLTDLFAEWEPVLQPRTYELVNFKLPKFRELIDIHKHERTRNIDEK